MPKFFRNCLLILLVCSLLAAADTGTPKIAKQSQFSKTSLVPKNVRLSDRSVVAARANRLSDLVCFIEQSWFHEWPWIRQPRLPTLAEFFQIHFADSPAAYLLSKPPGVAFAWTLAIKTDSPRVFVDHLQSFAKADFPRHTIFTSHTIAGTEVMRLSSPASASQIPLGAETSSSEAIRIEMTTACCCWSKQGWLVVTSDLPTAKWHLENWHATDSLICWASERNERLPEATVGVVEFESDVKWLFRFETERIGRLDYPQTMLLGSWFAMGSAIDKLRGVCSVNENAVLEWNVDVVTVAEKDRVHFGELLRCRTGVSDLPVWVDGSWDGGVSFHWDLERGPSAARNLLESLIGEGEAERFVARSLGALPEAGDPLFDAARSTFNGAIDVAWRRQPQSGGFTWVLRLGTRSEQAAERFTSLAETAIADAASADTPSLFDRSPRLRSLVPEGEKIPSLAQTVVQSYLANNRPVIQNASIWLSNDQESLNTVLAVNVKQTQPAHPPLQSRKPVPQSSPLLNAYCVGMLKDVSILGMVNPLMGNLASQNPYIPGIASAPQQSGKDQIAKQSGNAFIWRVTPGTTDISLQVRRVVYPKHR